MSYVRTLSTKRKQSKAMRRFIALHPSFRKKAARTFKKHRAEHPEFYSSLQKGKFGPKHPTYKPDCKTRKVEKHCEECGALYLRRGDRASLSRFCSRSCASRWICSNRSRKFREIMSLYASRRNHSLTDKFGKRHRYSFVKHGILYHSHYEYRFSEAAKKLGLKFERNTQRFQYRWRGGVHHYTPDFKLFVPFVIFIEIKGWPRPKDTRKLEAVRTEGFQIWMWTEDNLKIFEKEALAICQKAA